ncbi:MAG: STAS domain-containing protein [Bacteroidota bacterium]
MKQAFEFQEQENLVVVKVRNLLSEFIMRDMLDEASKHMKQGNYNYVVDLSEIDYMNSVGLNFLLILKSRAALMAGKVSFANPSEKVLQLLEMTKLTDILNPAHSLEAAIAQVEQ